jgi:hypothetical protein
MKPQSLLTAACVTTLLLGGAAFADCQSELQDMTTASNSQSSGGGSEGISKSGELAPLEEPDDGSGANASQGQYGGASGTGDEGASGGGEQSASGGGDEDEGISKDGSMSPLNSQADTPGVATSQQEAEAQQQAGEEQDAGGRAAAIEQARNALAAGDEDACMEALDRARNL